MVDAADQVGAVAHLGVFYPEAGEPQSRRKIDQEPGDIGGAEIDGKTERRPPGRCEGDRLAVARMQADRPISSAQQAWQFARGAEIDAGQQQGRCACDAVRVGTGVGERGGRDRNIDADHHRDRAAASRRSRRKSISGRTIGASERRSTSRVQSERGTTWHARTQRARGSSLGSDGRNGRRSMGSTRPLATRTLQVPQTPRPPQAPMMRTPLRRAE